MNQRKVIDDVREQYADVAKSSLSNDSKVVRSVAAAFGYSSREVMASWVNAAAAKQLLPVAKSGGCCGSTGCC